MCEEVCVCVCWCVGVWVRVVAVQQRLLHVCCDRARNPPSVCVSNCVRMITFVCVCVRARVRVYVRARASVRVCVCVGGADAFVF